MATGTRNDDEDPGGDALPVSSYPSSSSESVLRRLSEDYYKKYCDDLIYGAAEQCGASRDQIDIDWNTSAKRIVVTVRGGNAYVSDPFDDDDDDLDGHYDDDGDDGYFDGDDIIDDAEFFEGDELDLDDEFSVEEGDGFDGGVDVTAIARSINDALEADGGVENFDKNDDDDDVSDPSSMLSPPSLGNVVAEMYEIEVTTPGASDELTSDPVMFESYKGFDVIAQFLETKKKKKNKKNKKGGKDRTKPQGAGGNDDDDTINEGKADEEEKEVEEPERITKTVEGKLVERNDEHTVINIKGRMKKIPNDDVISVKLPKAKKEKGAR